MSFTTVSSILRGKWLIEPTYAKTQLPLVLQMLNKESTGFTKAISPKTSTDVIPQRHHLTLASTNVFQVSPYTSTDRLPYSSIAMIDVIGPVLKYGDWCSYGTCQLKDLIIRVANSDRVNGILLNIDSPGGQADGTADFAQAIREVSKMKPVIAVVQDGIAASAAMWIAAAAQEIYVTQPTDMVGSIGAYTTIYDFAGYFELNGIKVHDIYAPQSIDKNKDYYDALKGDYTLIENDLKFLVQTFIKSVQTNRGSRLRTGDENPFTGKMYNATDAKRIGLIDGIKSMPDVVKRIEQLIALRA